MPDSNQCASAKIQKSRALMLATTILMCGWCCKASAQEYRNRDENGVDLARGDIEFSLEEGSIGTGQNKISLIRQNNGNYPLQWDGLFLTKTVSGSITTVRVGQYNRSVDIFVKVGSGAYEPTKSDGSSLTGAFVYTKSDGTRIQFIDGSGGDQGYNNFCGSAAPNQNTCDMIPQSVTYADGRKFDLNYQLYAYPGVPYAGQTTRTYAWRLKSIITNFGYRVGFGYSTLGGGSGAAPPSTGWYQRQNAKFYNDSISASTVQSSVAYVYPAEDTTDITDTAGKQWRVTSTSIRRPDEITPSFMVSGSPSNVSSVTKDGITFNYARTVNATAVTMVRTGGPSGQITVVSNPATGRPNTVTNALGKTETYSYDSSGRLERITRPEGNYTAYTLDSRGNATAVRYGGKTGTAQGEIGYAFTYEANCTNPVTCNKPTTEIDPSGAVTNYTYDQISGLVTSIKQPASQAGAVRPEIRYSYTMVSGVWRLTGISLCSTHAAPACVGSADEVRMSATFDANGNQTSVARGRGDQPLNVALSMSYTPSGDIARVDGALPGNEDSTHYRYDMGRRLVGIISPDPDGGGPRKRRAERRSYDAVGRRLSVEIGSVADSTDAAWQAFVPRYSSIALYQSGRLQFVRDLSGTDTESVQQYSYDNEGRMQCSAVRMNIAPDIVYPTSACDLGPEGEFGPDRITVASYDQVGRKVSVTTGYSTSVASVEWSGRYTDNGAVQSVTDARGNTTTYAYDRLDRLYRTYYPLTSAGAGQSSATDYEELQYDSRNNIVLRRLRGYALDNTKYISQQYDALNRLVFRDTPGPGSDVSYGYDLQGRIVNSTRGGLSTATEYDQVGNIISETGSLGSVNYEFDSVGRRTSIRWPDNFKVNYQYDVAGNLTQVREDSSTFNNGLLASYSYDDTGRLTKISRGNGIGTNFDLAGGGRLSSLRHTLLNGSDELSKSFNYNPASQIVNQSSSNDAYGWHPTVQTNRSYANNGLNQVSSTSGGLFVHDSRGNLQNYTSTTGPLISDNYLYDSEDLLTSMTHSVSGVVVNSSLKYDAMNRLIELNQSSTSKFIYDGEQIIGEFDASNSLVKRYVYGYGQIAPIVEYSGSSLSSGVRTFLLADERGSVITRASESGSVVARNKYDEFGIPSSDNVGRFQYTGHPWFNELGLYLAKSRFYSPTLGRFVQADRAGYADGLNMYAYTGNDPINVIDPDGSRGYLIVYSRTGNVNNSHAWIVYAKRTSTGWTFTSYGTFNAGTGNGRRGLQVNTEFKDSWYKADYGRGKWISDSQEAELMKFLSEMSNDGDSAWEYWYNCAWFANEAFKRATGEDLSDPPATALWTDGPNSLAGGIYKRNGGRPFNWRIVKRTFVRFPETKPPHGVVIYEPVEEKEENGN